MSKIRWGVIGIRGIGQQYVRWIKQLVHSQLQAVVDIDGEAAMTMAQQYQVQAFTNHQDLLAAACVDAVAIATPHHLLAPIAHDCLQAGVHVFVEKPMATRLSEATALVRLAEAQECQLGVAFQYRTYQTYQKVNALLPQIGRVQRVLWTWAAFRSDAYYQRDSWRATWQGAGGGIMMNQVSHDLNLLCWLLGQPVAVSAQWGNWLHDTAVEDQMSAIIQFASGTQLSFQASINQSHVYNVRQFIGDLGMIVLPDVQSLTHDKNDTVLFANYEKSIQTAVIELTDHHAQPAIHWQKHSTHDFAYWQRRLKHKLRRQFGLVSSSQSGHMPLLQSFVAAIRGQGTVLVSGAEALGTVELINSLILAATTGRQVSLPLDADEYDDVWANLVAGHHKVSYWR